MPWTKGEFGEEVWSEEDCDEYPWSQRLIRTIVMKNILDMIFFFFFFFLKITAEEDIPCRFPNDTAPNWMKTEGFWVEENLTVVR